MCRFSHNSEGLLADFALSAMLNGLIRNHASRLRMVQTPPNIKLPGNNVVFDKQGKEIELPGLCDIEAAEEIMYLELILKAKVCTTQT
jgi:hypothetical protein